MSTVAVFGAGDVGGACAHALASRERVRRILLIDSNVNAAAGKALDIQQAGAISGVHTTVDATADETHAIGCAVIVMADRFANRIPEWQGEDGLGLVRRVAASSDAPLVFAGVAQADLMHTSFRELRIEGRRLIGSAPEAFVSAVIAIVAMEARCSPAEVRVAVLGTSPAFVIPWGEASIGGYALDRTVAQVQLRRIEARVARLWPPGPFALGAAAARVVEAVLDSGRRSYSVLTILDGEFGVRNRVAAVPVLLASPGVARIRTPLLNTREQVQLDTALKV
jgi:malate dehydrogenase